MGKTAKATLKEKFNWDVDTEVEYMAPDSEIITEIVSGSGLATRINVLEGVKNKAPIKLVNQNPTIQDASTCGWNGIDGTVLTDEEIETKRLKIQEEFCNEELNGTLWQVYNKAGANVQDTELPLQDRLLPVWIAKARKMNQDLMLNGDTTSLNVNLKHYDGFVKLWDNDSNILQATSTETSITSSNALALAMLVYGTIPAEVLDNGVSGEIICGRETLQKIIQNVYNDNNFHWSLNEEEDPNGEVSIILPTTNMRVRSYPQLSGTDKMYFAAYDYMFVGTDLEDDVQAFEVRYDQTTEKLRVGVKWRSGVAYVKPEYFVKLVLATAS